MFCSHCGCRLENNFVFCPKCGRKKHEKVGETSTSNGSVVDSAICSDTGTSSLGAARPKEKSQTVNFDAFKKAKESERRSHFEPKAKRKKNTTEKREDVLINVGLMELQCGEYKRVHGKSFPVKLPKEVGYDEALELSLKKWENYDRSFDRSHGYVLTYLDRQLARTVPGTEEDFTLKKYKDGLGKPYSKIVLLLAPTLQLDEKKNASIVDMLKRVDNDTECEELEIDDPGFADDVIEMESVDDIEGAIDEDYTTGSVNADSVPFVVTDFLPVGIDENDAVRQAINNSLNNIQQDDDFMERIDCPSTTLTEDFLPIIKEFANDKIKGDQRNIVVSRLSTWSTAQSYFRKGGFLKGSGMLSVTFASFEAEEDAADLGGPRREFFHLLLGGIACESGSLTNTTCGHVLRCNIGALQNSTFLVIGRMLATMVVQGGELPRLFSPTICQYIENGCVETCMEIEEVPDKLVRDSLIKLKNAETQEDVDKELNECEWKFDIDGLCHKVPLARKDIFINEVIKYYVIIRCQAMLDQLLEGLKYYDVLNFIRSHRGMAKHLFEYTNEKLDAKKVIRILRPDFAPVGNIRRTSQEIVMSKFISFLQAAEEKTLQQDLEDDGIQLTLTEKDFISKITPCHFLMFSTGATNFPTTGFQPNPTITFVHDETKTIPSAQTCANMLYLYVNKKTTEKSIGHDLLTALINGGVFSLKDVIATILGKMWLKTDMMTFRAVYHPNCLDCRIVETMACKRRL